MSDLLCVTNRKLCKTDFLAQIEKIAAVHPAGIILREKDLNEDEYIYLAKKVIEICQAHGTPCILHSFFRAAIRLGCPKIHLPLPVLRTLSDGEKAAFDTLGASCHSKEDALLAERLGCTYISAGHIFDTDCKRDIPGRGLDFLKELCRSVTIPVYAIGGISADNISAVKHAGAAGACIMSMFMTSRKPDELIRRCARPSAGIKL